MHGNVRETHLSVLRTIQNVVLLGPIFVFVQALSLFHDGRAAKSILVQSTRINPACQSAASWKHSSIKCNLSSTRLCDGAAHFMSHC
ncbi:hypothetical protein BDU57DRAFT_524644 [Ampelomyces quisqualis]|uniref:Uncharacterized protein n=1 Tax=Ampelomyces quisqualis TaxID=50730 RepID=A0A6A5Q7S3_AMPQU|nr:hypothetical protein BDU57DRAFT_524644 [Ampelomyces quisqualis]